MNIGLDIDDTITDTFAVMFGYGQKFTIEDLGKSADLVKTTGFSNHFYCQNMHGWIDEDADKFFEKYYRKISEETRPFMFAIETIRKLKEEGHKIVLITARWDFADVNAREITEKWLKEQQIPYDVLIVNGGSKADSAIKYNLDVFVDDSFENCKAVADAGIKTYIMDTRCNKGLEDEKIKRVYSWPHLEQELRKEII